MAQAISENDNRHLWNEAKKMKKTNSSTPNIIDNVSGSENISEVFTHKFKDLYNSVGFESRDLETLMSKLNKLINKDHTGHRLNTNIIKKITVRDVIDAVTKLKSDKKDETGLNINHLKLGSDRLIVVVF